MRASQDAFMAGQQNVDLPWLKRQQSLTPSPLHSNWMPDEIIEPGESTQRLEMPVSSTSTTTVTEGSPEFERAGSSDIGRESDARALHARLDVLLTVPEHPTLKGKLTAERLRMAQRWVGRCPGQMTRRQFAEGTGVPLRHLGKNINANGKLTLPGQQLLAGGIRGGALRGITADIVRQAQVSISGGQTREAFALQHNVSVNALGAAVLVDGALTLQGKQRLAGGVKGGSLNAITADIVRKAQASISAGNTRAGFAVKHNVSVIALRTFVLADGNLTSKAKQMLARSAQVTDHA
jgi:hypothetical protein